MPPIPTPGATATASNRVTHVKQVAARSTAIIDAIFAPTILQLQASEGGFLPGGKAPIGADATAAIPFATAETYPCAMAAIAELQAMVKAPASDGGPSIAARLLALKS